MKILHALVKSSLVFVLVEGERLLSLIFKLPPIIFLKQAPPAGGFEPLAKGRL